ncbi:MAG: hypothetical protein EOO38_03230 [Cytophagaceae bacterium]|nr:MAG: hypothetical protein EOO38_03230 [Cytophagaceae bacterium]
MCNLIAASNERAAQPDVEEPIPVLCIDEDPDSLVLLETSLEIDIGLCVSTRSAIITGLPSIATEEHEPGGIIVAAPTLKQNAYLIMQIRSIPKYRKIPIIVIIGQADSWNKALYTHLEVRGIVVEPYDPVSLSKIVRAMLGY